MKEIDLNQIKLDFSNPEFDINKVIKRVNDFFKSTGEIEALQADSVVLNTFYNSGEEQMDTIFDESIILLFILKEYIEFQEREIDMIRKAFRKKRRYRYPKM